MDNQQKLMFFVPQIGFELRRRMDMVRATDTGQSPDFRAEHSVFRATDKTSKFTQKSVNQINAFLLPQIGFELGRRMDMVRATDMGQSPD